jgi:hypothetical protein
MFLRITGTISALIGAALIGLGIYGIYLARPIAEALVWEPSSRGGCCLGASDWATHWSGSVAIVVGIGVILLVGGSALALARLWGLFAISLGALVSATYPWVLEITGHARYSFETAHIVETTVYLAIACATVFTFIAYRRRQRARN